MRLFQDGRGLLQRVRWVRVVAATATIGVAVSWARRDAADDPAAAIYSLKTIASSSMGREDERALSSSRVIDLGPGMKPA